MPYFFQQKLLSFNIAEKVNPLYNRNRCATEVFIGNFHSSITVIGPAFFSILALLQHMIHFCLMLAVARKPHTYCSVTRLEKYFSSQIQNNRREYLFYGTFFLHYEAYLGEKMDLLHR